METQKIQKEETKMKTFKNFLVLFLVLFSSLNAFSLNDSEVQNDDRGLFSNDESTKEKNKEKKSFWDRYFEIGVEADVGVSNNYFHISDFLTEEVVINMDDINNGLGNNGFILNNNLGTNVFINLNTNIFKTSIFVDIEETFNFSLNKGIFEFLANGNQLNQNIVIGAGIGASVFEENSFSIEIPFGKLKIKAVPSYFIPLIYVPYTPATVTANIKEDGSITMAGNATASVYSALPLNNLENFSYDFIGQIFSKGGFDFSLYGEYQLFEFLDIGAFLTHIPIVPSNLNCSYKYSASIDFSMDGLLNMFSEEKTEEFYNFNYELSENKASENDISRVIRPFKIGFNANWRVFNNKLLVVSPMIQFKFADFTLENLLGFGFDYKITATSHLGPFIPSFSTSYIDSVFSQQLNIALNLRLIEIDLMISTQSTNFLQSFAGSGLGVGVGVKVGF